MNKLTKPSAHTPAGIAGSRGAESFFLAEVFFHTHGEDACLRLFSLGYHLQNRCGDNGTVNVVFFLSNPILS